MIKKKKALLIGINNYKNPDYKLNGCINDVCDMYKYLVSHGDYESDEINLLTDYRATRNQIIDAMAKIEASESVFVYYSGHGSQIYDDSGDESDQLDERFKYYAYPN